MSWVSVEQKKKVTTTYWTMATFDMSVTQAMIDKGDRAKCGSCPIALAFLDIGATEVSVGVMDASFAYNGLRYRIWLNPTVQKFIEDFDKKQKVEPFTFTSLATRGY